MVNASFGPRAYARPSARVPAPVPAQPKTRQSPNKRSARKHLGGAYPRRSTTASEGTVPASPGIET